MLAAKRMREHLALFASLGGVAAIVASLSVGLSAYLSSAATDGVRDGLASAAGSDLALRASFELQDDATAQDTAVRDGLRSALSADGRAVPFDITRIVGSSQRFPLTSPDEPIVENPGPSVPRATGRSIPDLPELAELVDGDWPSTPDEASVQADAAERLDLAVGDRVRFGTVELTITATWRVDDPLAPRWMGEPLYTDGIDGDDLGPVVVDESRWAQLTDTPRAYWTLTPTIDRIEAGDLEVVVDRWRAMSVTLRDAGFDTGSLSLDGRLLRTATELDGRVDAVRAVQPAAMLVILAIGLVTLLELGGLLVGLRMTEIVLIRSRGATAPRVALTTAAEAAVVAVVGALLGTGVAIAVLAGTVGGLDRALGAAGPLLWATPLLTTLVATSIVGLTALRAARSALRRDTMEDSGRGRTVASLGGVVLLSVAAAISTWQFRLYGSPLTPTADGGTAVDPIAVLAPALALIAIVLLGLALLPLPARAVDRAAARAGGIRTTLVARTIARRIRIAATPVVLVALCCGQLIVAAGYATTWSGSFAQTRELRLGAPILLTAPPGGLTDERLATVAGAAAVTAVAPVLRDQTSVAGDYVSVVGAAPGAVGELANDGLGAIEPRDAGRRLDSEQVWLAVPSEATALTVTARLEDLGEASTLRMLVVDRFGAVTRIELAAEGDAFTGELPSGSGPLRVAALDVEVPGGAIGVTDPTGVVVPEVARLDSLALAVETPGGEQPIESPNTWRATSVTPGTHPIPAPTDGGDGFTAERADDAYTVRLLPSSDDDPLESPPPISPALISAALAERYGVTEGDLLQLELPDTFQPLSAVVTGTIAAVPSAESGLAMLIDLDAVTALRLEAVELPDPPEQLWIGTDDAAASMPALRAELPAGVRISAVDVDPSDGVLRSASIALWIGAIGAALLAFVAIGAVVGAQLRFRSAEIVVLRAIGLGSRDQAAIRRGELGAMIVVGAVLGGIAGAAVSMLTTAALARAAVPRPISTIATVLRFDPLVLGAALLAVLLVLGGILVAYGIRVAAQAATLTAREDVR